MAWSAVGGGLRQGSIGRTFLNLKETKTVNQRQLDLSPFQSFFVTENGDLTHLEQFLMEVFRLQTMGQQVTAQGPAKARRPAEPDAGSLPVWNFLA